jgi:hypothetical protein
MSRSILRIILGLRPLPATSCQIAARRGQYEVITVGYFRLTPSPYLRSRIVVDAGVGERAATYAGMLPMGVHAKAP